MKFKVVKDVIIDGTSHAAGSEITINHDKTDRLEMLGYIERAKETANRAVTSTRTRKAKKADIEADTEE